jgi:DNA-cytosine methyltransferase
MLKLLDLFSGIGGFSLGMEATNRIKTIAFVEKDKFCQKVLNKNFKNIPIEEDIRNVKGSNYTADIVSGGFPCQPFSVAGKRKGKDDDRYLWDETIRVVAETKPKWFVGENVEGIINISNGTVLQQIQQDLEKEGFQVQCLVIPASGVGAWHQRKRVWIIGCNVSNSNSNRNTNEIERSNGEKEKTQREHRQKTVPDGNLLEQIQMMYPTPKKQWRKGLRESIGRKTVPHGNLLEQIQMMYPTPTQDSASERTKKYNQGGLPLPLAVRMYPTPTAGCEEGGEQSRTEWSKHQSGGFVLRKKNKPDMTFGAKLSDAMLYLEKKIYPNTNSKGLQGCSLPTELEREQRQVITKRDTEKQQTWWEAQSSLCGVPNGISYELDKDRSNRIKALGNSIVPLIAYEIGKAIISAEDQSD